MSCTLNELRICGETVRLGDYVEVEYNSTGHLNKGVIKGKIIELWCPCSSKFYQAKLDCGWCFHNSDKILKINEDECEL